METQKISETLMGGSVDCKPVLSRNSDGKTLEGVSVVSSLSESCAVSELVKVTGVVPSSECYGGGNANVHKNLTNGDDDTELVGVGFESNVVDGYDNIDSEGVKGEVKLANVGDKNDLEGVDTEEKRVDGQGTVESENKLANMDDYNDLQGVEIENKFGDVDDAIDLEALGLENEHVTLENLMEGRTLKHEAQALGSIVPETNEINDGDAESGGEFNESQDNAVEKIGMVGAAETTDTSNVHVDDSPTKIEASGDGISLTVDVFGPLDGMYPVHNSSYKDGQIFGGSGPDCMFSMKTDSPMGVKGNEAEGNDSDYQEHNFAVGDLVWVKMKTLWWPGMICDPHASKDGGKYDQRDGFFVKHFGNTNSVWCRSFQLKPFVEYFALMSRQNKSKSFYGAIEKALGEFGRRVKQKMTCSCFSKENQVAAQNFPKEDGSGGSVFSASQFEPSNFLEFIRLRALGLGSPGSIEVTVTENCLSAFYISKGHRQLPLYKLRPTNNLISVNKDEDLDKLSSSDGVLKSCRSGSDDSKMTEMELSGLLESPRGTRSMISRSKIGNENAGGKSEKGCESRERKKSKYLSYPYVNSWAPCKNSPGLGEDETEDCEEVSLDVESSSNPSMVSPPIGNSSNKNSHRKLRKSVIDNDICNNADLTAASSAEMLQGLQQTALDCFFPIQSMCSVPIRDFYSSFRAFRDPVVQMDEDKEATLGCQETFKSDNILASGGYDLQVEQPPPSVLPKKRGRKKSDDINATGLKFSSITNLPRMTADGTSVNGSNLIDSVETGPDTLKKGAGKRKGKKAAIAAVGHNEIGVLGGLPDLNGNNAGLSVENMQVIGPAPTQGKLEPKRRRRKNEELVPENLPDVSKSNTPFIPLLKSVEVTGSLPLEGGPRPDNMLGVQGASSLPNAELFAGQPNANEIDAAFSSSLPNNSQINGLVGKKRKRKEKALTTQNNSSALPDLNGQVMDPNLKGKEFTELSSVTAQDKPKQKRRRAAKSAAIGTPNPSGDHNTLLLYFKPGSPVPSKEYISATFASFGPLEEAKTLYVNDSTAQVVFVKDSDAMEALQSLQSRNPFGPSLISYRLRPVSTSNNTQTSHSSMPANALQPPGVLSGAVPSNGEGLDLAVIKQNLEEMTTMLEKADDDDNISPEMKAMLKREVNGFMKKFNTMVGSSSS